MDPNCFHRHSRIEALGPAEGGLRWRTRQDDLFDLCRLDKGLVAYDPDDPYKPAAPEPDTHTPGPQAAGPWIASLPPPEGRAGEEYVYQARACDAATTGFTWYFEKSPAGMTVDRHSGMVTWTPEDGGYVEVVLCARSLYGAVARQSWTVCVRRAAVVRRPSPNPRFAACLRKRAAPGRPKPYHSPLRPVWRKGTRTPDPCRRTTGPPADRHRRAMPLRI